MAAAARPSRSDLVGGQLLRTQATYPRVRAFGEMVALLWAQGKSRAAGYSLDMLGKPANLQTVVDVAKLHGRVLGTVESAA